MSAFLEGAACEGRRPSHLSSRRHYPRPDLIARLLRERQVARFLVAPDGFGKTGLAFEYAETIFSFRHVFWLNGKSPCFLRDLDLGIIASRLCELDASLSLVVIDDVPPLDATRAAAFSRVVDGLLERGCEVLATCVPTCDFYAGMQRDRLKLAACDLLLSDAELDSHPLFEGRDAPDADLPTPSRRVPGLCWTRPADDAVFLAGIAREELPSDLLLIVIVMLILQAGSLDEALAFGPCGIDEAALLARDYPYLGIDMRLERFEAARFSLAAVGKAFSSKLEAAAARSYFPGRDAFAEKLADSLLARSEGDRACELMGALCPRGCRASWLALRSRSLLKRACLLPAHELYCTLSGEAGGHAALLEVGEALRLALLGDGDGALGCARKVAFDAGAPEGMRALASVVVLRCGRGSVRERARAELSAIVRMWTGENRPLDASGNPRLAQDEAFWLPLASLQLSLERGADEAAAAWDAWRGAGADGDALALAAAWMFDSAPSSEGVAGPLAAERARLCGVLVDFVRSRLDCGMAAEVDLFSAAAGMAVEHAGGKGLPLPDGPFDAAASLSVHRTEMSLFAQRRAFDRSRRERALRRAGYAATHPDAFLDGRFAPASPAAIAPLLTVGLFGGLSVRIGDEAVDARLFRRRKVKTLLALLVLNRGREHPRDRLIELLWPESDFDTGRKNFYSIWSLLRRALSMPSGECPYLIRQQNGCRLESRLLVSDVARFDEVCRTLLFGDLDDGGWARLYAEIDRSFSDDLLPSEADNELIVRMRGDCRTRLVDALVAASRRLVSSGRDQEGLWFARAALRRDRTREDAYTTLMEAQIAAGQRTAALETYFDCRRFLADELGIDPSLKTVGLYHGIIEAEEVLG